MLRILCYSLRLLEGDRDSAGETFPPRFSAPATLSRLPTPTLLGPQVRRVVAAVVLGAGAIRELGRLLISYFSPPPKKRKERKGYHKITVTRTPPHSSCTYTCFGFPHSRH